MEFEAAGGRDRDHHVDQKGRRMTQLDTASIVCRVPNPVSAEVAGEVVLMSLERSRCYGMGEAGSAVWKLLEAPIRVSDLVTQLCQDYEGDPDAIERDVLEFLSQLSDEGLVTVAAPA
jgi:hypothetical protein